MTTPRWQDTPEWLEHVAMCGGDPQRGGECAVAAYRRQLRTQIQGWRGVDDFIAPFADAEAARAYWNGRLSALDAVLGLLGGDE